MSYIKIWVHTVWGTKNRIPYLGNNNLELVLNHIKENSKIKGILIDSINGYHEHIHVLLSLSPKQNIADVLQLIKGESSFWINKNKICKEKFEWADEYYAVSLCPHHINIVREYIKNQADHHKIKTWNEECTEFLEKYGFSTIKG